MTSKPPILALAPHPWQNHWLSRQQLLSRMASRGWPILYSFGPLSLWNRSSLLWRGSDWFGSVEKHQGVWVDRPGRILPLWPKYPAWDRFVVRRHAEGLRRRLMAGHAGRDFILFLFYPAFQPWVEWLRPRHVIYHTYDVYNLMDDWSAEKSAMERALTQRADLITASSPGMAQSLPEPGPAKCRVLYNGADSARFKDAGQAPCPADLAAIPRPRIGYVGNINPKMDLEMVLQVSRWHPEWHWVFLGPVYMDGLRQRDRAAKTLWQRCLERENVHFLGLRSRDEIPAYVNHMDVNTICYKVSLDDQGQSTDWVGHGYPTKLHEYLATGRPVVAGPQAAVKNLFSHVVHIADTPEAWQRAIGEALNGRGVGSIGERQAVALENTWDKRVDLLESWILAMLQK